MKRPDISSIGVEIVPPIQTLQQLARTSGLSIPSLWRHRKLGWLKTINISGRVYISGEDLLDYIHRAKAGEFAKEHKVPIRKEVSA